MRRFTVRPRPLQPNKKIRVYHLLPDRSFFNDNGEAIPPSMYELEDNSHSYQHIIEKKVVSIPKPPIKEIPNYDTSVSHSFKRSNGFIKYIPLSVEEEENRIEYNLDVNDELWIHGHEKYGDSVAEVKRISLDSFEMMLDCVDRYAGSTKSEPNCNTVEMLFTQRLHISRMDIHEVSKDILEYWQRKKRELGKPLLRRFWPTTNVNDTNPNLVFRSRSTGEHYRLRKKNRTDEEMFERIQELKRTLESSLTMSRLVHQREQLKLRKVYYACEIVDEAIHLVTNPSTPRTIKHNLTEMYVYEGRIGSVGSSTTQGTGFTLDLSSHTKGLTPYRPSSSLVQTDYDTLNTTVSAPSQSRVTPEEKLYMQLISMMHMGGVYSYSKGFIPHNPPSLVISHQGAHEHESGSWLKPVDAPAKYTHAFDDSVNDISFESLKSDVEFSLTTQPSHSSVKSTHTHDYSRSGGNYSNSNNSNSNNNSNGDDDDDMNSLLHSPRLTSSLGRPVRGVLSSSSSSSSAKGEREKSGDKRPLILVDKAAEPPSKIRLRGRVGRGGRIMIDRIPQSSSLYGVSVHETYTQPLPVSGVRKLPNERVKPVVRYKPQLEAQGMANTVSELKGVAVGLGDLQNHDLETVFSMNVNQETEVQVELADRLTFNRSTNNDQIQFVL